MIQRGGIVIPAGSGKTTISKKYNNIYDIDSFHTKDDRINLHKLYQEVSKSNDWDKYNKYEASLIKDKLSILPTPHIILLHCREKCNVLGLEYLGSCKTSESVMNRVATERGLDNKLREEMTRSNWKNVDAIILESHQDIENYVIKLCLEGNIKLIKK